MRGSGIPKTPKRPSSGGRGVQAYPAHKDNTARLRETLDSIKQVLEELPDADNEPGAVEKMLRANAILRNSPWPAPFDITTHRLQLGDARRLDWIPSASVHLVVTSPPYWVLKNYAPNEAQLGAIADYEAFLSQLDKVWQECARVLAPGGPNLLRRRRRLHPSQASRPPLRHAAPCRYPGSRPSPRARLSHPDSLAENR